MAKFNKKKLPSRHTSFGPEKAPHRSFYYAMNLTRKDVAKPFVGVVSTWNEAAPCNIALMRQAQSVKKGVKQSGGTPREFCTITVTDGIAMGHEGMKSSLVSREIIADSAESAITSLEIKEDFIPSCPIAIPSVTVIVQNSLGVPLASLTPFFTD